MRRAMAGSWVAIGMAGVGAALAGNLAGCLSETSGLARGPADAGGIPDAGAYGDGPTAGDGGGLRLTGEDGRVSLGAGTHELTLCGSDRWYFKTGQHFRVIAVLADGSLAKSPVFTHP